MNSYTYFCAIVVLVLVQSAAALIGSGYNEANLGGLGERPRCNDATAIPLVGALVDPILQTPCEIITCLLNFTCEYRCESPLLTTVLSLLQQLLISPVCNIGLVICPDNLAIEKCLSSDRKLLFLKYVNPENISLGREILHKPRIKSA